MIEVIERHYKNDNKLSQKLIELNQMIAKDMAGMSGMTETAGMSDDSSQHEDIFLFFNELTNEAQIDFLESQQLEFDDIDTSKPIAKLKVIN